MVQSQPVASSSASTVGLLRPLETESDESGSNRVAYFAPDDEEIANAYLAKRKSGKTADEQLLEDGVEDTEDGGDGETFGFGFKRDYDAIRRDTNKEYIFVIEEGQGDEEGDVKSEDNEHRKRAKGAYYVPLVSHTLLRKRRARKGEVTNDYDDLGVEFWGGILVSIGGKELFPEDEIIARKDEIFSIRMPPSSSGDVVPAAAEETEGQGGEANGH